MHLPSSPPPPDWPRPYRSFGRVCSILGFALLTAVGAIVTVDDARHGSFGAEAVIGTGFTLLFGHLAGLALSLALRPRPSTRPPRNGLDDQGNPGLAFRYSWWPYYWLTGVLVMTLLALLGFAVAGGWALAVVAAGFALYLGFFLVVMLRLAPGRVVLTSAGIYHRSLVFEHFVPWDRVLDVQAQNEPTPCIVVQARQSPATRERNRMGRLSGGIEGLPYLVVRAHWLGANALPAYQALRRHYENPHERRTLDAPRPPTRSRHVDGP